MKMEIKMTGKWKEFKNALNAKAFESRLMKKMKVATATNALMVEGAIRDNIKYGSFSLNRPLTVAIKKSTKPLVDKGDLYPSISHKMISATEAFVGLIQKEISKEIYDLGVFLHQGGVIKVTKKMRRLFYVLWLASEFKKTGKGSMDPSKLTGRAKELWDRMPGNWRPLSTNEIVFKRRPYIQQIFENITIKKMVFKTWQEAINKSMKK